MYILNTVVSFFNFIFLNCTLCIILVHLILGSVCVRRGRIRWLWGRVEGDVRGGLLAAGRQGHVQASGHRLLPRRQREHLRQTNQRTGSIILIWGYIFWLTKNVIPFFRMAEIMSLSIKTQSKKIIPRWELLFCGGRISTQIGANNYRRT